MIDTTAPKIPSDIGALLWAAERVVEADRAQSLDTFMIGTLDTACKAVRVAIASQPVPSEFDVRRIMIDVEPGPDGMGREVYAKTVADVEYLLSRLGEKAEELAMMKRPASQPVAPAVPVAWVGLTEEERAQVVLRICEYGTGFVTPLFAVIEGVERILQRRNAAAPETATKQGPLTDEQFGASLPDEVARNFTPAELELFERGFRHAERVHGIAPDAARASRDGREESNDRGNAP